MPRYWKVLDEKGCSTHGGSFQYDLPKHGRPGRWTPRITNVVPCRSGYHLCRDEDLIHWCNGATIWAAEGDGVTTQDDKVVCESVRIIAPTQWNDTAARLFAVECAADVLHLMTDERSVAALEVAYRYALGDAAAPELDAAGDAAGAAAGDAWDAAGAAAWAAAGDAWAAAGDARAAAGDAVWAAAGAAAGDAARVAAWARQTARLLWWIGATTTYPED